MVICMPSLLLTCYMCCTFCRSVCAVHSNISSGSDPRNQCTRLFHGVCILIAGLEHLITISYFVISDEVYIDVQIEAGPDSFLFVFEGNRR